MNQDKAITDLLRTSRVIAMVGLSADARKPSNVVARYLKEHGYRVIPVNPSRETILGEKSYKSLSAVEEKIDIVDIFMRAEELLPVVREAVRLRPRGIWLQLGIVNEEAKALAGAGGVFFVMDRCVKQEHSRLLAKMS
jgi:predicted CoA-binding protein